MVHHWYFLCVYFIIVDQNAIYHELLSLFKNLGVSTYITSTTIPQPQCHKVNVVEKISINILYGVYRDIEFLEYGFLISLNVVNAASDLNSLIYFQKMDQPDHPFDFMQEFIMNNGKLIKNYMDNVIAR